MENDPALSGDIEESSMKKNQNFDLEIYAEIAIGSMPKDTTIDLLDDYCGFACYSDYRIDQLHGFLLSGYRKKLISPAEIIERYFLSL